MNDNDIIDCKTYNCGSRYTISIGYNVRCIFFIPTYEKRLPNKFCWTAS